MFASGQVRIYSMVIQAAWLSENEMIGMASWPTIAFTIGVSAIDGAYQTSRKAFEDQISALHARWQEHQAAVEAGNAVTVEENEETGAYFDFGEHIGEMVHEAEEGLRLVREAFVLSLYHYWEKKACELLHIKHYTQDAVFAAAKQHSRLDIDEPGIDRLRRIANCIKHDKGKTLFKEEAGMFEAGRVVDPEDPLGWHDALQLRDEDVENGFTAVRSSGPKAKPWTGTVEEVEF
jgi:hypothetical protein